MTDLLELFVVPLEKTGIDYMITGSVAAMIYGEPRLTNDIDLILELQAGNVAALEAAFDEQLYYRPFTEVILAECARSQRGHFNLIHQDTMLKADVYLMGNDVLHRWAMRHRQRLSLSTLEVNFAPPEYVILRKMQFHQEGGSDKHLRDIKAMLSESVAEIDLAFVREQSKRLGVEATWQGLMPADSPGDWQVKPITD